MSKISMGPLGFFGLCLGFIATIGGSYIIGQKTKSVDNLAVYTQELKAYEDSTVTPALRVADSLRVVALQSKQTSDNLNKLAVKQTVEINKLQKTNLILRQTNKSLADSVKSDTTLPPECDQCRRVVASLEAETDSLTKVIVKQEKRDTLRVKSIVELNKSLTLSLGVQDSLTKVIVNFPTPSPKKKILGVTVPNIPKKVYALGGFVAGILIAK